MDHTVKSFDKDLNDLKSSMLAMGGLVESQLSRVMRLLDIQFAEQRLDLIAEVLADEDKINSLHMQTDLGCNRLLAKHQPLAVDLREIIAVMHAINDIERIGDECKKIALKARDMPNLSALNDLALSSDWAQGMAKQVQQMLNASLTAFMRRDVYAASALKAQDKQVDILRDELVATLITKMGSHPEAVAKGLACILIVQSLERVGDHAKNLAEYTVHVVEGIDRRH